MYGMQQHKKIGRVAPPDFLIRIPLIVNFQLSINLVNQLVAFASEARKSDAISVAAFDSYLKNLKFWS